MKKDDVIIKEWVERNLSSVNKTIFALEKIQIKIGNGNHKEDINNAIIRARESSMWLGKIVNEMSWGK
jgi:predicted membrane protein